MFISHKRDTKQNIVSFIQCVQKYPALYDYTLSSYRSDEQEKAWLEVANQMGENPATCKEKWKNLRACLCRHLRTQVNSTWKRPYYLAEHMKFVIPFTKYGRPNGENSSHHANTSDNEADDGDESKMETFYVKQEVDDEMVEDPEDSDSLPVPIADFGTSNIVRESNSSNEPIEDGSLETNLVTASTRESCPRIRMKRNLHRIEPLERVQVEYLEDKKQKISSSYNDFSDLDFFRSLLPDIERMSHRQKIKFKLTVLGCIDNILYGQESDCNSSQ